MRSPNFRCTRGPYANRLDTLYWKGVGRRGKQVGNRDKYLLLHPYQTHDVEDLKKPHSDSSHAFPLIRVFRRLNNKMFLICALIIKKPSLPVMGSVYF